MAHSMTVEQTAGVGGTLALWNSGLDLAVAHSMTGEQTAGVGGTLALWNSGLDLAVAHSMTGEQTAGVGGTLALCRGCPLGFAGRFNPGYAWAAGRLLGKSCWALWYCPLLS